MPSLIDWYLVELKMKLQGRLPAARVSEIMKETESHLRESAAAHSDSARAEGDAIKAFGLPEKVASAYLGRRKLMGLNPIWWALIGTLISIYCWNFPWLTMQGYFDNFGDTWECGLAAVGGLIGLGLITAASRKGCKSFWWQLGGFTPLLAVLSIPIMSFWMIALPDSEPRIPPYEIGISRIHLSRDIDNIHHSILRLAQYRRFLLNGEQTFAKAKSPSDLPANMRDSMLAAKEFGEPYLETAYQEWPIDKDGGFIRQPYEFVVPYNGVEAMIDGRTWALERMGIFSDAQYQWRTKVKQDVADIDHITAALRAMLTTASEARHGKLFFPATPVWGITLSLTLMFIPVPMFLGWLGYLSSRRRGARLERALA